MIHDCDLCGSSDFKSIEAARPYIGEQDPPVVCMNCGFVYVRYRRNAEEIAKAWDEVWGEDYTSAWPMIKARLTYVVEWIDQEICLDGKSVLDIGAGEGTFLQMVRDRGGHPVGIEPCKQNVQQIRAKDIACFKGTAESVDPGQYDIVTVLWTLENTGDCIGFLKRAREFCRPDGHIVVATGSRILVPFKKPLSTYFSGLRQDLHCFRFSAGSLGAALMKADFWPTRVNRYEDSDWLIWLGSAPPNSSVSASWGMDRWYYRINGDDPHKVLTFFNDWARMFP